MACRCEEPVYRLSYLERIRTRATAGTKRVRHLLRSLKWSVLQIEQYVLNEANKEVERLKGLGKRVVALMDGSVVEKPESKSLEATGAVISSKAKRVARSRFGLIFNPPLLRPIRVMGMEWTGTIITGLEGIPKLAVMRFWTTKGAYAAKLREKEEEVLCVLVRKFGQVLTYVFDRGYASGPWLEVLQKYRVTFIIRWIKNHIFYNQEGKEKKIWQIGFGKKYLAHKLIRDAHSGLQMTCDLWWTEVRHPHFTGSLYLVRARLQGKKVMYLITNERVMTEEQAWGIFFSYKRRWQIEMSFRYAKCELALECPRLWSLEARLKLLGMVMLVYAFLLSLLDPVHHELVEALLRFKCHRTGKRCQNAQAPLYRLRWALSRLWDDYRPRLTCFIPPSDDPLAACSLIRDVERISQNWG